MSGFPLSASGATASNTRDPTPPPGRVRTQPPRGRHTHWLD